MPSAHGAVSENEAWAAGSQEPTKGDLNKMYSAMQYEKTHHGNTKPLETHRAMKSGKDKHNFWRNFVQYKKFNWLSLQEILGLTKGEKEYYYQAQKQIAVSNNTERQLMTSRQGKITQAVLDQLTE